MPNFRKNMKIYIYICKCIFMYLREMRIYVAKYRTLIKSKES